MSTLAVHTLSCLRGERLVFSNMDFTLTAGQVLVLRGANGSGKSSLLRLLAGVGEPLAGHITWDGEDIATDRTGHAARLTYVGHANAVKPQLTVQENLTFWAAYAGEASRMDHVLHGFDLAVLADVPGHLLSAGQRRRVTLARLCLSDHPLWLLDEPTAGLDAPSRFYLEHLITTHGERGGLTVLSTHEDIDPPGHKVLNMGEDTP